MLVSRIGFFQTSSLKIARAISATKNNNNNIWRAVKRAKVPAHKEQRVLFFRTVKDQMEPRSYHGLGAKRWRGTLLSLTHMRRHTYNQHPLRHVAQPSMQQGQRSPNTMS